MTKLYRIDVRVYATAYIKADTPEEALEKAKALKGEPINLEYHEGILISGDDFEALKEDQTLSPAMTIFGPEDGDYPDFVHDYGE